MLAIDFNGPVSSQGAPENRHPEELLLGDEAELGRNEGEDYEDVEKALVVGHKNLRSVRKYVFRAPHFHFHA